MLSLFLLSECEKELIVLFMIRMNPNIANVIDFITKI